MNTESRREFEEWAEKDGYTLRKAGYASDIYASTNTRFAWEAWQAAREQVTEQRNEARRLAEKYRNLSCDSQEEADETLLPWETTEQNKDNE